MTSGRQLTAQKRIFPVHVFEVPSAHGDTIEVHSRPQDGEVPTGPSVSPHSDSIVSGKGSIPSSGQREPGRKANAWFVASNSQGTIGLKNLRIDRHFEIGDRDRFDIKKSGAADIA
jgi:hypothetical protein